MAIKDLSLWSRLQKNFKNNQKRKNYRKRSINSNLLSCSGDSDTDEQKSPPENHNKRSKKTVVHAITSDADSDEEADIQSAIAASLRTLAQEKDKKQKSVVSSSCTLTLISSFESRNLERGSTSSLPTCVVCQDVIDFKSIVYIDPCYHRSCRGCITRYICEQVNLDICNVVCPEEKCGEFMRKGFIERWVPDEVYDRMKNAKIELSVLKYTFRFTCPFEECGRNNVDDERGYQIRACTWCWRLFCSDCWKVCHMGMSCREFKRREKEAKRRREKIVWRREKEKREKKQDKKNVYDPDIFLY